MIFLEELLILNEAIEFYESELPLNVKVECVVLSLGEDKEFMQVKKDYEFYLEQSYKAELYRRHGI